MFPRVLFSGLCCSLSTLRHSAMLPKVITWITTFTQTTHISTFVLATLYTNRSLNQLTDCLHEIFQWMTGSKLKLNADKPEFLIIDTPKLSQHITPASSARNLGVTFDNKLNFRQHVSQTCRCCFHYIRDLRRIRRYMSLSVAKTIATALVRSRLDYCNFLLHNITINDITTLQRVQKFLVLVVTRYPRFSRSASLLKSLH